MEEGAAGGGGGNGAPTTGFHRRRRRLDEDALDECVVASRAESTFKASCSPKIRREEKSPLRCRPSAGRCRSARLNGRCRRFVL